MYISCPECDTKFAITDEQIGQNGRRVKCSKCGNIWHHKTMPENDIPEEKILSSQLNQKHDVSSVSAPFGNGVNLPALRPAKIPYYLYMMPFIMIGLIILMVTMILPNDFGSASLLNSNNIVLKDIQIQHDKNIGKIIVNYKIHNISNKQMKVPLVRIRLLDKTDRVVKSLVDDNTHMDMLSDQFLQIKTEFVPAPKSVENIDMMVGNKIDFLLR
ncbi:zinc-ribbon domain-containing protein [Rickettsiaceae bacterium]|nr:zinc-ribbon domain-containing protein [Rickettsiaceae bacterium]